MNKKQLVAKIADKLGVTKKETAAFLDAFVEVVTEALSRGENVKLVGFGTFEVIHKKERKGVNPQTKKPIKIPAKKVPKFKPGKDLREAVK